jgi:hypothetical protein
VKRVLGLVFVFGAASCVAADAAPQTKAAHAAPASHAAKHLTEAEKAAARRAALLQLAPADEYFGPLKQSIIGIRNTIRDLGLRYDVNHDIAHQTYSSALLTERAIRDWEHRYPKDDQLPRAVFYLQRLYTKVLSQESRDHAHLTADWMFHDFGRSPQARQLKKTLALEHLAPIPPPTPAPTATPAPTEFGSAAPSAVPIPAGSSMPMPSGPTPAASPSTPASAAPAPSPTPAAKR